MTQRFVEGDFKFVGLVIVACLFYLIFHTRSVFLGFFSLINICMSVPIALCIYSYIFQIYYFQSIHLSIIIIIVGIGSDDVFVFHDAWKTALTIPALRVRPIHRLSYTFKQASSTMLVTSLTSAVAFLACTSSQIMPIQAFGVFAAIIVPTCFIITIVVQPLNYYIYEKYILGLREINEGPMTQNVEEF